MIVNHSNNNKKSKFKIPPLFTSYDYIYDKDYDCLYYFEKEELVVITRGKNNIHKIHLKLENNNDNVYLYGSNFVYMSSQFIYLKNHYSNSLYKLSKKDIFNYTNNQTKTPNIPYKSYTYFYDKILIEFENNADFEIRYSIDNSTPNFNSKLYQKPFFIDKSTNLLISCFKKNKTPSFPIKISFEKINNPKTIYGDWNGNGKDSPAYGASGKLVFYSDFDYTFINNQIYGGVKANDYISGDWDGDGIDNIGLRRKNKFYLDTTFDGYHDIEVNYKFDKIDNAMSGDFNGNKKDGLAVYANNKWHIDNNLDGKIDSEYSANSANKIDQYFTGDYNGDRKDTIAWRCGNRIFIDNDLDGKADKEFELGTGKEKYISGDWNGDGISVIRCK